MCSNLLQWFALCQKSEDMKSWGQKSTVGVSVLRMCTVFFCVGGTVRYVTCSSIKFQVLICHEINHKKINVSLLLHQRLYRKYSLDTKPLSYWQKTIDCTWFLLKMKFVILLRLWDYSKETLWMTYCTLVLQ